MAVEKLTKRTIYVSECPDCGDKDIRDDNPPRERKCKCGAWLPFIPVSYVGPDNFSPTTR